MFRSGIKFSNFCDLSSILRRKKLASFIQTRSFFGSDHVSSWKWNRIIILSMFPAIPVAVFLNDKVTDTVLAGLTVAHSHKGLMSITTDYIHKAPRLRKLKVRCFSSTIFFGLFFMIHLRGQGLIMTIRRIWAIEPPKKNYYETTNDDAGFKESYENSLEEKTKENQ